MVTTTTTTSTTDISGNTTTQTVTATSDGTANGSKQTTDAAGKLTSSSAWSQDAAGNSTNTTVVTDPNGNSTITTTTTDANGVGTEHTTVTDSAGNVISDTTTSVTGSGDQSSGDQSSGDQSSGDQSSGDQSSGDQSSGDQSSGDGMEAVRTHEGVVDGPASPTARAALLLGEYVSGAAAASPSGDAGAKHWNEGASANRFVAAGLAAMVADKLLTVPQWTHASVSPRSEAPLFDQEVDLATPDSAFNDMGDLNNARALMAIHQLITECASRLTVLAGSEATSASVRSAVATALGTIRVTASALVSRPGTSVPSAARDHSS